MMSVTHILTSQTATDSSKVLFPPGLSGLDEGVVKLFREFLVNSS